MKSFQDETVLSRIDSGGCTCYFSVIRWWKMNISDFSCIDSILVSFELLGALELSLGVRFWYTETPHFWGVLGIILTQGSDSDSPLLR